MSKKLVVRTTDANTFAVTIDGEAVSLRDALLAKSEPVINVSDLASQNKAVAAAAELKGLSQATEKERKLVKQPYWDACGAIDSAAKKFIDPVDTEIARLELLVSNYVNEQKRIDREKREEQERRRIAAEQAAAQAQAELERAKRAQEDTAQAELDAMEAQDEANEVAAEVAVEPEPIKVLGGSVREKLTFTLDDPDAFYQWDLKRRQEGKKKGRTLPSFCVITVTKRDFTAYINMLGEQADEIPGITVLSETKVSTKASTTTLLK